MLSIPHIPVVHAGLTHLSLGKIIWSEDGIVETVHRNASTLKVLSVAYARTTQALGLVVNAQEQPVIFPELVKLNLRIHSGVPMENREICSFNPFPKLQHLEIPGAFPFANGNLLNSKHLKTLVLGVSNHSLKTLRHTAVFSGKRNFEYVDIRMLPIEDPALFPMADFTESTGLSEINLTLCYNLVLSSVSSVPFFKVRIDLGLLLDVSNFISHIPENCNISELDLGSSVLSLNQATQLIAALPRLVHLKYTLPSIEDSTSDIPVIHHEKLEQITVTTAASAETCINDADYLAYMCFRVKSLLRLNVYAKESCREIISKQFWQKLVALDPFLEKVIPSHLSFASLLKFKREELPVDVNCVYTD
ncbi:hypothetical protein GGI05_006377 [Coemansia sp. RSA 2603]|nr:hypothetical protein GGI05_006377 [Coemansia sp. RSA 2603]